MDRLEQALESWLGGEARSALQIVEALDCVIAYVDTDQRLLFANRTAAEHVRQPRARMIGMTLREVLAPEHYLTMAAGLTRALAGTPMLVQADLPGYPWPRVNVSMQPDTGPDGRVAGLYILVTPAVLDAPGARALPY